MTGLGQVQIELGELDGVDGTLREGLEIFERMGLVTEICYVTILLAHVMSANGDSEGAAEAASCVRADASSDRPFLFQATTIAESAAALLEELSATMEFATLESAVARGEMKGIDVLVKELLTEGRLDLSVGA